MASGLRSVMDSIDEGVGSEAPRTSALDCPTSGNEDVKVAPKVSTSRDVVLKERLWSLLPEVILDTILLLLPPAAKCRFRCVCRRWKSILSSSQWWMHTRSPCTIMTSLVDHHAKFFCHSENKWFNLPFDAHLFGKEACEVVDTDAGVVCHRYHMGGRFWFLVSNPLSHSARSIAPNHNPSEWDKVKLLVDRETKTFKLLVLNSLLSLTEVYDSATACWHICTSHPRNNFAQPGPCFDIFSHYLFELFVWRNVIYAYPTKRLRRFRFASFNMESGQWTNIKAKLPFKAGWWSTHFVGSDEDQVMFIQFWSASESGFRNVAFWKLLDNGSSNVPKFSRSMWEKVDFKLDPAVENVLGRCGSDIYGGCYQKGYFSFIHSGYVSGSRRCLESCVKYSFGRRKWDLMPYLQCKKRCPTFYSWEPSLNIDFELNRM